MLNNLRQAALWLMIGVGMGQMSAGAAQTSALVQFDFTKPEVVQEWQPTHDVRQRSVTPEGMLIEIGGDDPYLHGPARDYPPGQPLWLRIRLKSEQGGTGQVFYYTAQKYANEPDSVRFPVRSGVWEEIKVPMPPLGPKTYLRLDPPGTERNCLVASLSIEPRTLLKEPTWSPLGIVTLWSKTGDEERDNPGVRNDKIEIIQDRHESEGFAVRFDNETTATRFDSPLIGYLQNGQERWLDFKQNRHITYERSANGFTIKKTATDHAGAVWTFVETFTPNRVPNAIDVVVRVSVSQDRDTIFLPMLLLNPGGSAGHYIGTPMNLKKGFERGWGKEKRQALFAGLEYLDAPDGSSSEADIHGPGSRRQVPDSERITLPLMVSVQPDDLYIGLIWKPSPDFSAVFDSPDRLFHSHGNLMGILFPGSDGVNREEGSLLPYEGKTLKANTPLTLCATIIGGKGNSIVPAVQQYLAINPLPPLPAYDPDFQNYARLAAMGWLDSGLRDGDRYRHAAAGNFTPQIAPDAGMMMDWLALQTTDAKLADRLRVASKAALAQTPPQELNFAGIGHVRYPAEALVYGHVAENTDRALQAGRDELTRFTPDGRILFQKRPDGLDYGKTHFAPDANGLTAPVVANLLENATLCGDEKLLAEGLRLLRALDKFENTVPRGAQTWEVPLHTPDILASAHLVRAYTLGYEITGDPHFLEEARYWAWTGVPFLYLHNPTSQLVGLYATVPVLGATQWIAPNWMGLPVQWCGLVYADALYRFLPYDPNGPWKQIADGITISGIQQTWPVGSDAKRQGLLPDSFTLRSQTRNDTAINPNTLLVNAARLFHRPMLYDFRSLRVHHLFLHAPGLLSDVHDRPDHIAFTVQGWPDHPYFVLVVGLKSAPRVRINGKDVALTAPNQYLSEGGRLILQIEGKSQVEIDLK